MQVRRGVSGGGGGSLGESKEIERVNSAVGGVEGAKVREREGSRGRKSKSSERERERERKKKSTKRGRKRTRRTRHKRGRS